MNNFRNGISGGVPTAENRPGDEDIAATKMPFRESDGRTVEEQKSDTDRALLDSFILGVP